MPYDPDFLTDGIAAPLPTFSPDLDGDIVRSDRLRDGIYADYPTFSLVMNGRRRSPAFVALNIDQDTDRGKGKKNWTYDTRIERRFQQNNDYYKSNPWDRGHMARRASAAWGATQAIANRNSRETYYWTNSVLQHQWLNQDEWLGVEDWVRHLEVAEKNRVCSISGPIYSDVHLTIEPNGRPPAAVPNAFFKVVMFRHRDAPDELSVRAFILHQNETTMRANGDFKIQNLQTYQVPIRLIEEQTGLRFPMEVVQANPLFFQDEEGASGVGNPPLPEVHEIDFDLDIIDPDQDRTPSGVSGEAIRIAAAMVNPEGRDEAAREWVSLINVGATTVDIEGWTITDQRARTHTLAGKIEPGTAIRVQPLGNVRLRNNNGSITLKTASSKRVDRAHWIEADTRNEEVPVVFMDRDRFMGPAPD